MHLVLPLVLAAAVAVPSLPALSEKEEARAAAGKVVMLDEDQPEGEGRAFVQGIALIEAPADAIWAVLLSEDHLRASSSSIKSVSFYEDVTEGDIRRIGIAWTLKVAFSEISYHTVRQYRPALQFMTWELDDTKPNDLDMTEGSYSTYTGPRPETTWLLYRMKVDVGEKVPTWLEDDLAGSGIRKYLEYVQKNAATTPE